MYNINDNDNNNNFLKIFQKMTQNYEYKIKNKQIVNKIDEEYTFNNFISSTFNIKTALKFLGNSGIFFIINIKKEHNVPGLFLSNLFFYDINNNNNIEKKIINMKDTESEILINRNLTIKILKIKNIIKNIKETSFYSIKNLYKTDKTEGIIKKKIKIIYAESCPYILPEKFIPDNNFKYLCREL
jgi:hypothetical protein